MARRTRDQRKAGHGQGWKRFLSTALCLALSIVCLPAARAANPSGDLRIEVIAAYNLVVDSNAESPPTYAPKSAYVGAKFYNDGTNDLTDVFAYIGNYNGGVGSTPGIYPTNKTASLKGPLQPGDTFALTHEGGAAGTADATRYIEVIPAGGYVTVYWLVSYPQLDENDKAVWGPSIKPDDDLRLDYDIWATANDAGATPSASVSRSLTLRNEISAMANKIYPNTANKVPDEYQQLLNQYVPSWTNGYYDGALGTRIILDGFWYDLGNIGQGFDNNGDLVPDQNAWLQPIGDPSLFDPSAFRLVHTYAMVVVKLKNAESNEMVYIVDDQLYFQNVPDNSGAIGLVRYEFMPVRPSCVGQMTPYQEVASGYDNEKFNGDYGASGPPIISKTSTVVMAKSVDLPVAALGDRLNYTVAFTNNGNYAVGAPEVGMPLVVQDSIPTGTVYITGSATSSNVLPLGVTSYKVLYSTNYGGSWTTTEPATNVTDLQWWLSDQLQPGSNGIVRFSVRIADPYTPPIPLVTNLAGLSYGYTTPFAWDDAQTLLLGSNSLGDMVFADTGAGAFFGNGIQDGGETGISNVTVKLYYDANTNGLLDSSDVLLTTMASSAVTNGYYLFSRLPDGKYLSVVDMTDADIPVGYTATTSTWYSVDLDSAKTNLAPVVYTNADFGFAPALTMAKSRLTGSPTREGSNVTFSISVTNRLQGGGTAPATYTIWATNGVNGAPPKGWADYTNAFIPPYPDGQYATQVEFVKPPRTMDLMAFVTTPKGGSITSVVVRIPYYSIAPFNAGDSLDFAVFSGGVQLGGTYSKECATMDPLGEIQVDVTALKAWSWSDFTNGNTTELHFSAHKAGGAGSLGVVGVDEAGFRVSTDQTVSPTNNPDTTLNPVPLTDTYNASNLQYVSASVAPLRVTTNGTVGTIYWPNIGPIYAGGVSTLSVTFKALEIGSTNASVVVTNYAMVTNATYASGRPANTATSDAPVTILRSGAIGDTIWWDMNGNRTQDIDEVGIAGVYVVLTNSAGLAITNVTDRNGYYLFDSLPSNGVYTITILTNTITGGAVINTYDEDGNSNSVTSVTLTNLENHLTADFGYRYLSWSNIIVGTVWNDLNRNGASTPDSGEPWLTNVTVYLFRGLTGGVSTAAVATQRTDVSGYYRFAGNYTGDYSVVVVTNTGMMTNQVWTQTYDTDWPASPNLVAMTNIAPFQVRRGDFSYYQAGTGQIGDTVYYDWNGDRIQQTNEEGIVNIPVYLYLDRNTNGVVDSGDSLIDTKITSASGYYLFTNLPAATNYLVVVDQLSSNFPPLFSCTADPYGANDGRSVVTLTNAQVNLNQDFGYQPYGYGLIGDTVWKDLNGDGIQAGALEAGIANITVTLKADMNHDGTYQTVRTTTTSASGYYEFANLPDGNYRVEVDTADADLPMDSFGYVFQPTTATAFTPTITNGSHFLTADFGFMPLGAIGDTVFWDGNQNGTQDSSEKGIYGVTVRLYSDTDGDGLYDVGEPQVGSDAFTDTNGVYLFTGVATGKYVVVVEDGVGTPINGAACSADPNADGVPFGLGCDGDYGVTVYPGTVFLGADFGYVARGVIGDTVWIDMNSNGVRDVTELAIPYVPVVLYSNGTLVASNTTDAEGYYLFSDLPDGTYEVRVLTNSTDFPSGLFPTYDAQGPLDNRATNIVISGGHIATVGGVAWSSNIVGDLAIDFGYRYAGNNSLSGTVGLEGGPVFDGMMGTGTNGVGTNELPFGGVTVYIYRWSDANTNGSIDMSERTLIAWTTTSTNGDYSFTGLPNGSNYIVSLSAPEDSLILTTATNSPGLPSWRVVNTTNAQNYTTAAYEIVRAAPSVTNVDFAFKSTVLYDFGDLPDSYNTLRSSNGARHRVKTVPDLYLGLGVDTEIDGYPGVNATGDDNAWTGSPTNDEDGVTAVGAWTSTGQVHVVVGKGSGWLVGFVDLNQDGEMTYPGEMVVNQAVTAGVYTFSFATPTNTFSTTNVTTLYTRFRLFDSEPAYPKFSYQGTADDGEVEDYRWDFGVIGDYVWKDVNADGVQDSWEPPLTNVLVFIDVNSNGIHEASEPSVRTDASGLYHFGGLSAGSYTVVVDTNSLLPAYPNLVASYDQDNGTNGANNKAVVSITNGQIRSDVDFGYQGMAIGGLAWYDSNTNGLQEAGELAGITNILVRLYDSATNWIGTTYTGTNGHYIFDIATPGNYFVEFFPIGYLVSPRDQTGTNANDTLDSDASTNAPYRTSYTTISAGERELNWDIGLYHTAYSNSIGDYVWYDYDRDGIQDTNESGFAGITVDLCDTHSNVLRTTTTDIQGLYYFAGMTPSNYLLHFSKPTGYSFSSKDLGGNDAVDSDVFTATGYTPPIAVGAATVDRTWDAGLQAVLDLGVTKVVNNALPDEGETIRFTVTVTNNGPSQATGVEYTDLWPATNLTFIGYGASQGSYNSTNGVWTIGSLSVGASAWMSMTGTVQVGAGGHAMTNVITLTRVNEPDTNSANNSATATVVVAGLDIAVYKVVDNPTPYEGSNILYSIAITNLGPRNGTNVVLTDVIPSYLTYLSNTVSQGSYNSTNGQWAVGYLAVSNGAQMTIRATVNPGPGPSVITNTATRTACSPADTNPANDSASALITVRSVDLGVDKTVDRYVVNTNETVTYTIVVTNNGPVNATHVQLRDPLTNGITYVSYRASTGTYSSASGIWSNFNLAVSNYATLWITARVDTVSLGKVITNRSVVIGSDLPDRNPSNNQDTAVIAVVDLQIRKWSDGDKTNGVDPGSNITYTIVVSNDSPEAHTDIYVTDATPPGVTYVVGSSRIVQPITTNTTVRDNFDAIAYSNNNGTAMWGNSWQEVGDDGVVNAGNVQVAADGTNQYALMVSRVNGAGAWRQADLSGYRSATLSFDYRRVGLAHIPDYLGVSVSSNGGASWVEIGQFHGIATDPVYLSTNTDITAYISTNTAVQFLAPKLDPGESVYVDNVQIQYSKRITVTNVAGSLPNLVTNTTLEPNEMFTITFRTTVPNPPTVLEITNTAWTKSSLIPTPISATAKDRVKRVDLGVTKAVNQTRVAKDAVIWYTIVLTNNGPHNATGIQLTDYWPTNSGSSVIFSNATPSTGTFNSASMIWSNFDLAVGNFATLVITGKVVAPGDDRYITNVVTITKLDQFDTNPANNTDKAVVETLITLGRFEVFDEGGSVVVEWETLSEIDTAGFYVFRQARDGAMVQVGDQLLPAVPGAPQGGVYRLMDPGAMPRQVCVYELVEVEGSGKQNRYGPFRVVALPRTGAIPPKPADGFSGVERVSEFRQARLARKLEGERKQRAAAALMAAEGWGSGGGEAPLTDLKIKVRENGIYYLSSAEMAAVLGSSAAAVSEAIQTGQVSLKNRGEAVTWLMPESGDGIYFYGEKIDSIYTADNVYRLKWTTGSCAPLSGSKEPLEGSVTVADCFTETVHFETNRSALTGLPLSPQADVWFWDILMAGNAANKRKTFTNCVAGVAGVSGPATLTVRLQGTTTSRTSRDHWAIVSVNGTVVGEGRWLGQTATNLVFTFDQSLLVDGTNRFTISAEVEPLVPMSYFYLDWMELTYQRRYEAVNDQLIFRGSADGTVTNGGVTLTGLSSPSAQVVELRDSRTPCPLTQMLIETSGAGYQATFAAAPSVRYAGFTMGAGRAPASVAVESPSDLTSLTNEAQYLIITVPALAGPAAALADYRRSRGLAARVVLLGDIYDEFNQGIADPYAIQAFLKFAYLNWAVAPRYVLLIGEGSYDYKGYKGSSDSLVPPIMVATPNGLFGSDSPFVDFNGDRIPEMAIGRLPVMTAEECQLLVDKIKGYEGAVAAPWQQVFTTSAGVPGKGGDFTNSSEVVSGLMPSAWTNDQVYLTKESLSVARAHLKARINGGTAFLNFFGHGSSDNLGDTGAFLLTMTDAMTMTNATRLPIVTAMTCLAGRFDFPNYDSVGETLVVRTNGGACAVWAPVGLSLNYPAEKLAAGFYGAMFQGGQTVIGEGILAAKAAFATNSQMSYLLDVYNLLGDPALTVTGQQPAYGWGGGNGGQPPTLEAWLNRLFTQEQTRDPAISSPMADPDGDGVPNIAEYMFGGDPWVKDDVASLLLGNERDTDGSYDVVVRFKRNKNVTGWKMSAEVSPDLATWLEGTGYVKKTDVQDDENGSTETVKMFIRSPAPGRDKGFIRLRLVPK